MRKPSEILQLALDTGRYLSNELGAGEHFMCFLLQTLIRENIISFDEEKKASDEIHKSFNGRFLISSMYRTGVLDRDLTVRHEAYKILAYKHWEYLIEKLKNEGK